MKSLFSFLLAAVAVCMPVSGRACDVCGCGLSTGSLGFLPLQQRHFLGIRSQFQRFQTLGHEGTAGSEERFRTLELWGRWQLAPRWQLIGLIPYQSAERQFSDGTRTIGKGWGDVSLLTQYTLLDPRRHIGRAWQHSFQVGAGIKLPTGKYQYTATDGSALTANLQPGTGSSDGLLTATYILRHDALGIYLDGTARLTTANSNHYRFGNRLNSGARLFWWKPFRGFTIVPHAGILLDAADLDADQGKYQGETGGYSLYSSLGTEVYIGSLALGLLWQAPIVHHLAENLVTPHQRLSVSATWMFGKQKAKNLPAPTLPNVPAFPSVPKINNSNN